MRQPKTKAPVTSVAPLGYVLHLTGQALVLETRLSYVPCHAAASTYEPFGLTATLGERIFHAAFLSPDHRFICVVGGSLAYPDVTSQQRLIASAGDNGRCHSFAIDGDGENAAAALAPQCALSVSGEGVPLSSSSIAPKVMSCGLTFANTCEKTEVNKPTSEEEAFESVSGEGIQVRYQSTPMTLRAEPNSVREPNAKAVSSAPSLGSDPPSLAVGVPIMWRISHPMVECFSIDKCAWFAPLGQQRRAAEVGGAIRWPTQAATALVWECALVPDKKSDGDDVEACRIPHSPLGVAITGGEPRSTPPTASQPSLVSDSPHALASGFADAAQSQSLANEFATCPDSVCLVGGWDGVQRLSTLMWFSPCCPAPSATAADVIHTSLPIVVQTPLPRLSHHSGTLIKGTFYIFGGNTTDGCSNNLYALMLPTLRDRFEQVPCADNDPLAESALHGCCCLQLTGATGALPDSGPSLEPSEGVSPLSASVPCPVGRSSHAACALYDRFLIIYGGRQSVLPAAPQLSGRPTSKRASKAQISKPTAKRGDAKGRKCIPDLSDEAPSLHLLGDVAVYDCEKQCWVQVVISGGEVPTPRYGAALCLLPVPLDSDPPGAASGHRSPITSAVQSWGREIIMHGGVGEDGIVLHDAWLLQAVGKSGGNAHNGAGLLETDPSTGAPSLPLRWIRLRGEESASATGRPADNGVHRSSTQDANGSSQSGAWLAADNASTEPLARVQFPARCHHALVATARREVYIIGGALTSDSRQVPRSCAEKLPILHLPPLTQIVEEEMPQRATHGSNKGRRK